MKLFLVEGYNFMLVREEVVCILLKALWLILVYVRKLGLHEAH